jgi:hypothetical protein
MPMYVCMHVHMHVCMYACICFTSMNAAHTNLAVSIHLILMMYLLRFMAPECETECP